MLNTQMELKEPIIQWGSCLQAQGEQLLPTSNLDLTWEGVDAAVPMFINKHCGK